jgi:hypothetical protein
MEVFWSNTESSSPWNGVHKYTAGKLRSNHILTTLKTDNNYTTDMQSKIKQMIEHFVPEESEDGDEALDAAWWPAILNNLRDLKCPRNLYYLTRSYFSDTVAILRVVGEGVAIYIYMDKRLARQYK